MDFFVVLDGAVDNEKDFETHNLMPRVKDWLAKLPELADRGVTVVRMSVLTQSAVASTHVDSAQA